MKTGAYTSRQQKRKRGKWKEPRLLGTITSIVNPDCSIIDMGASVGLYVDELRKLGYDVIGVDGTKGIEKMSGGLVEQMDLSGDCRELFGVAEWGLFFEVGEHVPRELEEILLDNVASIPRSGLIVTWAVPGQRGCGHVNCRTPSWVAVEFFKRGWNVDDDATALANAKFKGNRILVFRRSENQ